MDLFSQKSESDLQTEPLAHRMRPRTIDEFCGQEHILGEGRLLRRAIKADQLSSLIFYGPPGTGKTTLARVIANTTKSKFMSLNAVLSGVKQLRESIDQAVQYRDLYQRKTILFIDEVHRWNKSQQDALLPWVENGTVILIGATTENPYFEVNSALVSRSRIFQLKKLERKDLEEVSAQALSDKERGYGNFKISFEKGALEHLIDTAAGDARSLLNSLQLAVETTPETFPPPEKTEISITMTIAEESIQKKVVLYDKEGDYHYDTISAFIKSIRGSDPDAALYWMAKMVHAGEDPKFIFRRMLISASEDIGLADPNALQVVTSAAQAFDRIGLPEGRFHLTQAALYLATAPKSNSSLAFFDALAMAENESEVPNHLRDDSRDKKGFGHGEGYMYPHAFRNHWVAQHYLPESMQGKIFYQPGTEGYEGRIRDEVFRRREIQLEQALNIQSVEQLSFSPEDREKERWLRRAEAEQAAVLAKIRTRLFSDLKTPRHSRVLDLNSGSGLFVWEALRKAPEGGVWAVCSTERQKNVIEHFASQLALPERPNPLLCAPADYTARLKDLLPADMNFELISMRDLLPTAEADKLASLFKQLAADNARILCAQKISDNASRLGDFIKFGSKELNRQFAEAEQDVFIQNSIPDQAAVAELMQKSGFAADYTDTAQISEARVIREQDIDSWFDPGRKNQQGYGTIIKRLFGGDVLTEMKKQALKSAGTRCEWKTTIFIYRGHRG